MNLKALYFNVLRECCYVLWDETLECVIIDPGFSSDGEFARLKRLVTDNGLKPVKVLLTHGHFDHVLGLEAACKFWGVKAYFNEKDREQIERASLYSDALGIETKPFTGEHVNVADGEIISFGTTTLKVIETPGHTQGGVCYLNEAQKILFSGDTLFAGSIGRTDHLGGNLEQILESINTRLMTLDGDIVVYPGHGPRTDIAYERSTNPFL